MHMFCYYNYLKGKTSKTRKHSDMVVELFPYLFTQGLMALKSTISDADNLNRYCLFVYFSRLSNSTSNDLHHFLLALLPETLLGLLECLTFAYTLITPQFNLYIFHQDFPQRGSYIVGPPPLPEELTLFEVENFNQNPKIIHFWPFS